MAADTWGGVVFMRMIMVWEMDCVENCIALRRRHKLHFRCLLRNYAA